MHIVINVSLVLIFIRSGDSHEAALFPIRIEPWHEISNILVCATSKGSDQLAHTRSLIRAFASHSNIL